MNPTDLTLSARHNWLGLDIKVDFLGLVISPHSVRVLSNIVGNCIRYSVSDLCLNRPPILLLLHSIRKHM